MTSVNQLVTLIPHPIISPESTVQGQQQQPLTVDQPLFTSVKQPVSSVKQPIILANQSLNSVQYPVATAESTGHQQQKQPFSPHLPPCYPQSIPLPIYQMPCYYPTHHSYYWVPSVVAYGSYQLPNQHIVDCSYQDQHYVLITMGGSLQDWQVLPEKEALSNQKVCVF